MNIFQILLLGVVLVGGECCSHGFEDIGGYCLALHTEVAMPWEDARYYCQNSTVPAAMAKLTSGKTIRALYQYITEYAIKGSFWLGASDLEVEDDWVWLDFERVSRGTPFWAIHSNLIGGWTHEPSGGKKENCLMLDEQRLYYFNDESCVKLHHPLCQEL